MPASPGSPRPFRLRWHSAGLLTVILAAALVGFPIPAYASQATADGLVGYWKFDETSAGSFVDVSGHANAGTGNGATGTNNTPQPSTDVPSGMTFSDGRSLSFDGTDDYVAVSSSTVFNPPRMSVAFWVRYPGTFPGTYKATIAKTPGNSYDQGWGFTTPEGTAGYLSFWIRNYYTHSKITVADWTQWHHIVGTYDGTNVIIYADGVAGTTTASAFSTTTNGTLQFGNAFYGAVNCILDDVRIYNRVLSATEIADLAAGRHTQTSWKGSASTAFENAGNWSGSIIPDPYTRVTIPFRANQPVLTGAVAFASLTINTGASLKLNGTGLTLKDSGTFTNYGTLQLKGNETLGSFTNDTSHGTVLVYGTGSYSPPSTGLNYYNLNLNDGLVGYWKFDETSGTRAADSSGYGNSGSLLNGPTISSTVAPTNFTNARSLSFDGAGDRVSLSSANKILEGGVNAFSISAWVFPTNVAGYGPVVHKATNAFDNGDFLFGFNQGGGTWFVIHNGSSISATAATLSNGRWYHLAGTWSAAEGKVKMYVDGVKGTDGTLTGTFTSTTSADLQVGQFYSNLEGLWFSGSIDDVRIYNRALSAGEIAALAAGNQPSLTKATVTLSGNLDINGDLTMNGGTLDVSTSNYSINVGGKWLNNGGTLNARKGTVTFDGTTSGLEILSGGQRFDGLTFNGAGAVWNMRDRLTASGTLTLAAGTLDASGSYALRAGTINQTSGVFTPRTGVVVLTSPSSTTASITSTLSTLRIEDPTENGLVGYWKFDEGTNTGAILDSSGYGNTGVRRGGAGKVWSGSSVPSAIQFDNPSAMLFDGTDDFVDAGSAPALRSLESTAWTLSAWLYPTVDGKNYLGASHGSDATSYILFYNNGSKIQVNTNGSSPAGPSVNSTATCISLNTWNHLAVSMTPSGFALYCNGNAMTVNTISGTNQQIGWSANTFDSLIIGGYKLNNTVAGLTNGRIDDVRIYNRALSANEITNLARGRYASGNSATATITLGSNLAASTLVLDSGNLATSSFTLTVTNALQILRGNGSVTLGSVTTTLNGGLTLSGGTLTGGAGTVDVNGAVVILTGSLVAPSGTMTVSGNWNKTGGTFTHNSGTVQFDGTNQTLTGSLVFFNLTKTVSSADTFRFAWNGQTSVSGALTLRGASSNLLTVRSTKSGTAARLILDGDTGTQSIDYLNVADNDASGGAVLVCYTASEGCVNGGNTTNWQIVTPTLSFSGSTLTKSEASGTASLVITLSGSSLIDITIPFRLSGTATGTGADFTILTPSPLILQAGETSTGILVRFQDDSEVESDETIVLTLGTPTNAATGTTASMTVTLTSDDVTPAAPSSSSSSLSASVRVGGGGHRGSDTSMQQKIAAAQQTILAGFAARQSAVALQGQSRVASSSSSASSLQPIPTIAPTLGASELLQQEDARKQTRLTLMAERAVREDRLLATVKGQPLIFADVRASAWYAPYVSAMIEEGIAQGYADQNGTPTGEFGTEAPVTYGELAKMAINASGKADEPFHGLTRNQSALGTWAAPYVRHAEVLHLSVFTQSLDVHTPATRGAVVQTVLEALGIPVAAKVPPSYEDVRANNPYAPAIAVATLYGIVEGDRDASGNLTGSFRPNDPISRAEVAKIIALAHELTK